MIDAVVTRNYLVAPLLALAAASFGVLVAIAPLVAAALVGSALVVALGVLFPVANLTALIFLTAVVPYGWQNRLGGGPGLLPSDSLLLMGAAVAALLLVRTRVPPRARVALVLAGGFLALALLQFAHGLMLDRPVNKVGAEFRFVLGFATLLVALPVVLDAERRQRLYKGLLGVAIALGAWGVFQYFGAVPFAEAGDAGLRPGVLQTSGGRGQIQGGLFGFPVATTVLFAVLLSGGVRSRAGRAAVVAALALNSVSVVLTFERTFWVATVLACLFVVARGGRVQRARALVWAPIALLLTFATLTTVAPGTLETARERLLSLGQYGSDNSVRYRLVESEHVIAKIRNHPIQGNGFAASIFWGRPWEQVPATEETFAHNGYLWLAWKLGIPAAILLVGLLAWSILVRGPAVGGPLERAVRDGSQASILLLCVASVTFPAFNSLAITPAMGLLLAFIAALSVPRGQVARLLRR